MLSIGGVVLPVLGWIVGVVLLWVSDVWSTRDKLLGTFVTPGGIGLPLIWLASQSLSACGGDDCGNGTSAADWAVIVAALALFFGAPIATIVHLARRTRTRPAT
jgi:hypothetical protein